MTSPSKITTVAALAGILSLGSTFLLAADPLPAPASESTMGGSGPLKNEIDAAHKAAVKKGLKWLAEHQNPDGGFGDAGITGLAGLALLADGNMPGAAGVGQGPYGKNVARALEYVMKSQQPSGFMGSEMYSHGFATLFLAEAYGESQDPDLKEKLQKAILLIIQTQNKQGGWRYNPVPQDADISITICEVMALRAARNAGIKVPKITIDRAIDYVKKSQQPDGGFSYTLEGGGSAFPRSAAGLAILYYAGIYKGQEISRALAYLKKHIPGQGENANASANAWGHYFYGNYYGTQAMFMAGGENWGLWWPAVRQSVIARQGLDGSWSGEASTQYATSMALIILQVPNRLLPILQK